MTHWAFFYCKQTSLWKDWGIFGTWRARVSVWHTFGHIDVSTPPHYTSDDFFIICSIWSLISWCLALSIVAIPQRAWESGKHSDFGGTCKQLLHYLGRIQTCILWSVKAPPKPLIALQMLSVVFAQLLTNINLPRTILKAHFTETPPSLEKLSAPAVCFAN